MLNFTVHKARVRTIFIVAAGTFSWTALGGLPGPPVARGAPRQGVYFRSEARPDAPAILVRLRPGAAPLTGALGFGRASTLPPPATGRPIGLESSGAQALADVATVLGVTAVEAPFADLAPGQRQPEPGGPGDRLARCYRFLLAPGADPRAAAQALAARPEVEAAEPEGRFSVLWVDPASQPRAAAPSAAPPRTGRAATAFDPNDPYYQDGTQWGLRNTGAGVFGGVPGADIDAPHGWDVTTGSTSTLVSIVDTGFDLHHPDLVARFSDGQPRVVRAMNGSIETLAGTPDDSVGHGTLVAGVALALTNNGPVLDNLGMAGVIGGAGGDSMGCRVVEVKATPTHYTDALASELARSIELATDAGARAINLSFGGDDDNFVVLDAISYAATQGTVVICGAGNSTDTRPQYPGYYARYGDGVSVAAITSVGALAAFSTHGPQIDVVAPGDNIESTYLTYQNAYQSPLRDWAYSGGTSFAAPFVTGLAGLATTLQPSLRDNEFQHVLRETARDLGAPGRDDTFGWGLANAPALLARLAPPQGFVRGRATAASWTRVGGDSITIARSRINHAGCEVDGRWFAQRWEVRARVTLPPGVCLTTPDVIVHAHGSNGWRADTLFEYNLGWGEPVPGTVTPGGFDLRAYVYYVPAPTALCNLDTGPIGYLPVQPQDVRFDWAVLSRLDAPPVVRITNPPADGATWPVDAADTLRWSAFDPDTVSSLQVAQSVDGGATWNTLATLPGDARSFAYAAPCDVPSENVVVRVRAFDLHGALHDVGEATRGLTPNRQCLVGEVPVLPPAFELLPIAPNPSVHSATLRLRLPDAGARAGADQPVLAIHDVRGRLVRRFLFGANDVGPLVESWDGRDDAGRAVPAGVYFARLTATGRVATQRFVLIGAGR